MDDNELYFSSFLAQHRRGELDAEIAVGLGEVTRAAQETGKPGQIIITLTVKANPNSDSVVLVDEVKLKVPQASRAAAIYYIGPDGQLQRNDPAQADLFEPVRTVDRDSGEIRRVEDGAS